MRSASLLVAAAVTCGLTACSAPAKPRLQTSADKVQTALQRVVRRVVLLSIDGLMPDSYLHPEAHDLRVPNLRRFVANGAYSDGVSSVFPSVTYPAHTTIATGVHPARHGIYTNTVHDPLDKNMRAWRWYAEDIRVPTLWQAARKAGLHTALLWWPVTVGAEADVVVPEYWRASEEVEDNKLIRALSTPGLFSRHLAEQPTFMDGFTQSAQRDRIMIDLTKDVFARTPAELVMVHITDVDHAQHLFGPWSREAISAIESADALLGQLVAGAPQAGTAFVVVSDHGFQAVNRQVHPGALLREAGLVQLDAKGKVSSLRASVLASGGLAFVYLQDSADTQTADQVRELFAKVTADKTRGIERIYDSAQIRERGGDDNALLALSAQPGVWFGGEYQTYEHIPADPHGNRGTHGYDPALPAMRASLLMMGAGVTPGVLAGARLIDVAPTVASWLGIPLPEADGRVLSAPQQR